MTKETTSVARPAPKGASAPIKSASAPPPQEPKLTPTQIEIMRGQYMGQERSIKALLEKATSSKEKDRLKGLLEALDAEKAEWKKKGIIL